MNSLHAVWCVGLLWAFALPFAPGQSPGEKAKDPSHPSSKPVRVGGVEFAVAAEESWERPAQVYGEFKPGIDLRISNRTDKDLTFDLGDTLRVSLKTADDSELVKGPIAKRHFPKPVRVAAGKSETVTLHTRLVHTRGGHVCLGVESDAVGTNWLTDDIRPGKYRLCLSLENTRKGDDSWHGKMQTKTLEIEVKDGK